MNDPIQSIDNKKESGQLQVNFCLVFGPIRNPNGHIEAWPGIVRSVEGKAQFPDHPEVPWWLGTRSVLRPGKEFRLFLHQQQLTHANIFTCLLSCGIFPWWSEDFAGSDAQGVGSSRNWGALLTTVLEILVARPEGGFLWMGPVLQAVSTKSSHPTKRTRICNRRKNHVRPSQYRSLVVTSIYLLLVITCQDG